MGTAAFVALLMALCDHRFTATQYALLSALAAIGRVFVGPVAGYVTDPRHLGLSWAAFFFWACVSAIPGLVVVWLLRKEIEHAEAASSS
jgi:MFS transporter, PAT family, beta-lactamase induction signal transducer AmpG